MKGEGRKGVPRLRIAGGSRSADANSRPKTFTMYNSSGWRRLPTCDTTRALVTMTQCLRLSEGVYRYACTTTTRACIWDTVTRYVQRGRPIVSRVRTNSRIGARCLQITGNSISEFPSKCFDRVVCEEEKSLSSSRLEITLRYIFRSIDEKKVCHRSALISRPISRLPSGNGVFVNLSTAQDRPFHRTNRGL